MRVKYTIETVMEENKTNWGCVTDEQALEAIKEYIKDDPSYVIDSLDNFSIAVKLVKD